MLRTRLWIEMALAAVTGVLTAVTLVSREWIEVVFGVDPDQGNGTLEWLFVLGLALATAALTVRARTDHRRLTVGSA